MKVSLDCIIYGLQRFGGISTYWRGLVAHLSQEPDVDLTIRLPRGVLAQDTAPGIAATPARRDLLPARIARYLPVSVDSTADLHHSSYYRNPISARTRSVVTVHDFIYEKFRRALPRLVHSAQKLSAIRRAQGIICISQNTRRDLLEYVPQVDPEQVAVIPMGVDFETMRPLSHREIDRSMSDVVLFVGQRADYKRFDLAVRAVQSLKDLRLGIAGPALTAGETAFLNAALGKRWIFFGRVMPERLRVLYGSGFAFIYPSSYEGFGLPVLEAMACGAPTIVANLASLPEVGGEAALYAEGQTPVAYPQNLASLSNASFRGSKIREGLARARLFSWETTFQRTVDFYRTVLARSRDHCSG